MERHDGLARAGRARDARRAVVLPFDELALGRVQEDGPLLPGIVQRPLQRLQVRHHPEAALRVRMRERIGARQSRHRTVRRTAGRKLQQRLGGLARQMIGEVEQRVLGRGPHVVQPLDRHAVTQQIVVRRAGEERWPRCRQSVRYKALGGRRDVHFHIPRHTNLADRLADFDELRSARCRMPLQSPTLGPLVRRVVMIDVAEQEAGSGPMDDQPDVATDPNGPEVLVLRPVDLVQLQPRMRRVHLQVERRRLDGPLLVTGQLGQAVGEGVGDAELHQVYLDRHTDPVRDLRPEIHVDLRGLDADDERISRGLVVSLEGLTGLPPTYRRVDRETAPAGEIRRAAAPDVRMQ